MRAIKMNNLYYCPECKRCYETFSSPGNRKAWQPLPEFFGFTLGYEHKPCPKCKGTKNRTNVILESSVLAKREGKIPYETRLGIIKLNPGQSITANGVQLSYYSGFVCYLRKRWGSHYKCRTTSQGIKVTRIS